MENVFLCLKKKSCYSDKSIYFAILTMHMYIVSYILLFALGKETVFFISFLKQTLLAALLRITVLERIDCEPLCTVYFFDVWWIGKMWYIHNYIVVSQFIQFNSYEKNSLIINSYDLNQSPHHLRSLEP